MFVLPHSCQAHSGNTLDLKKVVDNIVIITGLARKSDCVMDRCSIDVATKGGASELPKIQFQRYGDRLIESICGSDAETARRILGRRSDTSVIGVSYSDCYLKDKGEEERVGLRKKHHC